MQYKLLNKIEILLFIIHIRDRHTEYGLFFSGSFI